MTMQANELTKFCPVNTDNPIRVSSTAKSNGDSGNNINNNNINNNNNQMNENDEVGYQNTKSENSNYTK